MRFLDYILSLLVFIFFFLTGLIVRKILFTKLVKFAERTSSKADDIIIHNLKAPLALWFAMWGFYLGIKFLTLPTPVINFVNKALASIFIISLTLTLSKILTGFINFYGKKYEATVFLTGLTRNLAKIVIYIIGFLFLLSTLGISITPLITTLGIGGLAVALALQDTLSNLFAGFHILLAKQIRVGDYIKLDTGDEGYVVDITWRATKVRMLPNNIILIPNSKLAQSIVTNFCMPEKELLVLVDVGVHYDSDLEKVERVTLEVAEEVMREVEGGVPEFKPFMRYHTFGDFSINFTVILRAKEFIDQYRIKHEFIKRLHRRYQEEGIVIPYPISAINLTQEGSDKLLRG